MEKQTIKLSSNTPANIDSIKKTIDRAMNDNQLEILQQQSKKYLRSAS